MDNCTPIKRIAEEESNGANLKKPKTDSQEEEEHFARLFNEALEFIQKTMKVSQDELNKGVVTVIESFKYDKGNQFSHVDYNNSANLCAFFYRYSQLSTELSRSTILEAMDKCEELRCKLDGDEINVVSVGGGPGCDVVGLCSVLYKKVKCHKLNIAVADSNKRWKSFLNIVEFLLREGDFGNASNIIQETNASISFMCEDVCNAASQSTAYFEELGNADVIIMKSLLSILSFREKSSAVQNVAQKMKDGAVLLFIDSPYCKYLDNCGLEKIYTSFIETSPQNSPEKNLFIVQGSPIKNCGPGIAHNSKAQIAVFMKKEQCDVIPKI